MNNQLQTLSLFETTKEQRAAFCAEIINQLEQGAQDPLKVHLQVKSMEDIIKQLNDNPVYKSYLLDAASQHGKKFAFQNAEFSIKEAGTRYDYSQCGDTEAEELELQINQLTEKLKARYKFLQTVPAEGIDIRIGDEMVTVYPPSKSSTTTVAVTLK